MSNTTDKHTSGKEPCFRSPSKSDRQKKTKFKSKTYMYTGITEEEKKKQKISPEDLDVGHQPWAEFC